MNFRERKALARPITLTLQDNEIKDSTGKVLARYRKIPQIPADITPFFHNYMLFGETVLWYRGYSTCYPEFDQGFHKIFPGFNFSGCEYQDHKLADIFDENIPPIEWTIHQRMQVISTEWPD